METVTEIIGPVEAERYLARNLSNRKLRKQTVEQLAGVIRRGWWQTTHQGIAFDVDGNLLDGQHRLKAIVLSGMAVEITVTRGLQKSAFTVIDVGLKRNFNDLLDVGRSTGHIYTAMTRFLAKKMSVTIDMVNEVKSNTQALSEELIEYAPTGVRFFSSAPVKVSAVLRMTDGQGKDYVKELYRNLTLVNLGLLPPIGTALNRQVFQGKANAANQNDTMARMWVCFDKSRANNQKIQISDPTSNLQEMRAAYIENFGTHKWMPESKD